MPAHSFIRLAEADEMNTQQLTQQIYNRVCAVVNVTKKQRPDASENTIIVGAIASVITDITTALHERIKALEERQNLQYKGTWKSSEAYAADTLTTHRGSMWISLKQTISQPGTDHDSWRLVSKSNGRG